MRVWQRNKDLIPALPPNSGIRGPAPPYEPPGRRGFARRSDSGKSGGGQLSRRLRCAGRGIAAGMAELRAESFYLCLADYLSLAEKTKSPTKAGWSGLSDAAWSAGWTALRQKSALWTCLWNHKAALSTLRRPPWQMHLQSFLLSGEQYRQQYQERGN